jgi:undecaprenyl-diphosphatase
MFDQELLDWTQAHHLAVLDRWMPTMAAATAARAWVAVAAVAALFLVYRGRRAEALWLFGGSVIGSSLASILKPLVHRARPPAAAGLDPWSFPSGHATSSVAVLSLLAFLLQRRSPGHAKAWWGIAVGVALLIGFNRIYLAVHWPTDVLGGWLIGGGFACLWCRLYAT